MDKVLQLQWSSLQGPDAALAVTVALNLHWPSHASHTQYRSL